MTGHFRTESQTMVATAGKVDQTNHDVQAELARLRGTVDAIGGSWQGSAQLAFTNLMSRWDASARQLQEALSSISENIRANARAFDVSETENETAFRRVGGGLAL
ncbi:MULTISPECIES: WXG100 family type VII secretion target [Corynebacterium]|uniref:WXG100 family type VII secretion target n=1 Tax=Corynebacterium TaxID=1716 RepID=UPI00124EA778|nr:MULTISPECIES: WXG100 family type VII secretion target [Corynebacterium]